LEINLKKKNRKAIKDISFAEMNRPDLNQIENQDSFNLIEPQELLI